MFSKEKKIYLEQNTNKQHNSQNNNEKKNWIGEHDLTP